MTLTPVVWAGWQPGTPLPSEIQVIADQASQALLRAFYSDGSPVIANGAEEC